MIKTWRTRDGKEISIKEMTDAHLENTIRMMERKAPIAARHMASYALAYAAGAPEMAAYAAEEEAEALFNGEYEIKDIFPQYGVLRRELNRRRERNELPKTS